MIKLFFTLILRYILVVNIGSIDKFSDFYGYWESYTKLYLLVVLFAVSILFYMWEWASRYVLAEYQGWESALSSYHAQVDSLLEK